MAEQEIENTLKGIISKYTEVESSKIDSNSNLQCDIGLDSFSIISMVTEIETTFSISIPDEELSNFSTVDDMVSYIAVNA